MANYLTTDTDLTAVADAIREKGGTSGQLVFPQGFVDAVNAIEAGGGGIEFEWATSAEIVTIGANTVANTAECVNYFSSYNYSVLVLISPITVYNQYLMRCGSSASFRNRGGFAGVTEASNYDAVLVEGTKYLLLKI